MSASLVGSEMCIRDRASRPPPPGSAPGGGSPCCGRARAPCTSCGRGSVSYTHLTLPTICSV
eukprot:2908120-Alexandrium_andersonii.AAC.1